MSITAIRRFCCLPQVLLSLCGLILFYRKSDQFFNPQFWAEDGYFFSTFFQEHWASLLTPYAGYLHLLPRLIAGTSFWWDPAYAPAWFVGCSVATTLYVTARALSPRQIFSNGPILALAVVLVPDAFEVLLNVTNLQWILAAGFALLLLSEDPKSLVSYFHDVSTVILVGLTGPFSVILAPLFWVRAFTRKSRASWLLAGLVSLTALIQINFIRQLHDSPAKAAQINTAAGLGATGTRLAGSLFTGGRVNGNSTLLLRYFFAACTVAMVVAIAMRRDSSRPARLVLATAFALLLTASLYRCRWVLIELQNPGYGARYFYPLQLFLIWLLTTLLNDVHRAWRWSAFLLLAGALFVNAPRLRESALDDLRWASYANRIRSGEAVVIPINPDGWSITLPAGQPSKR